MKCLVYILYIDRFTKTSHFCFLDNWVKNLIVVTYLNRFILFLRDESFQEQLRIKERSGRASEKDCVQLWRITFWKRKTKETCKKFVNSTFWKWKWKCCKWTKFCVDFCTVISNLGYKYLISWIGNEILVIKKKKGFINTPLLAI